MPANYFYAQSAMLSLFVGFAQIKADSIPDGIIPKRQVVGTGVTTSTSMSSTTDTPTSSDSSSETPSSSSSASEPTSTDPGTTSSEDTSSATPSSDSSTAEPSSTDVPTTIPVTTTNSDGSTVTTDIATSTRVAVSTTRTGTSSDTDIVVVGSSTIDRDTLSSATVITSALVATQTIPATRTSVWTTNGQVLSSTYTTDQVVESTTGFATQTISPSLQGGNGSGSSLSPSSKKIIGGVVGGIGGAILLGGLAVVAWRLWGKKRRQRIPQDDNNDIFGHSPNDSIGKESRYSGNTYNQGQQGTVNTASNF